MKQFIKFLIALVAMTASTTAAQAIKVKSNLGSEATVTFYDYGESTPVVGMFDTASPGTALDVSTDYSLGGHFVVVHIETAEGYWTDASLMCAMDYAMALSRNDGMEMDLGNVMTYLQADEDRIDGSGWYYYQIPVDHASYLETTIMGFVVPKFDLSTATSSGTTITVSRTTDDWVAEVKINTKSFTYNGMTQCPAVSSISIKNGTTVTATPAADGHISVSGGMSNSGSYTATLKGDDGGLFTGSKGIAYSISTISMSVTAKGWSGVYDGNPHGITVTKPNGATVRYRTKSSGSYNLSTNPTFTDAGTYTVYYQVTKTNYTSVTGSKTVRIDQKEAELSWSGTSLIYTGSAQKPVAAVSNLVGEDECTVSVSGEQTNVGNYTATASALSNANYKLPAVNTQAFVISEATISGINATGYNDVYDGAAHGISVTAPEGTTVKFGTTEGVYDLTASPTYTDAGTYTVYYKVSQANYTSVTGSKTVVIGVKAVSSPTITLSQTSFFYDGKAKEPTVIVKDGETQIPVEEYTVSYSDNTAVGKATVTITDNEGGNYNVSGTATFDIILKGDANGDGVVNVADVVMMVNDGKSQADIDETVKIIMGQ